MSKERKLNKRLFVKGILNPGVGWVLLKQHKKAAIIMNRNQNLTFRRNPPNIKHSSPLNLYFTNTL